MRLLLALLLICALYAPVHASEYRVPLMPKAPVIDGEVKPQEWAVSAGFDGLVWQGELERRRARAFVGATADHLYLALMTQLPSDGPLTSDIKTDSIKLVYDDSVEAWIDPTPGVERGRTYQVLTNALQHAAYAMHPRGGEPEQPDWRGGWRIASAIHNGWWHCEMEVPLAQLTPGRTADQGVWGINLCRNWKQPWSFSSLSPTGYQPNDVKFIFTRDAAPAVTHEHHADPITGELRSVLSVTNPGTTSITVRAETVVTRDRMPEANERQTLTLTAGDTKQIALSFNDDATRKFDISMRVTSSDGAVSYYDRAYRWQAGDKKWQWTTTKPVVLPIDFQFAYYPYLNRMRVLADVTGLTLNAKVDKLTAIVRKKGTTQAIKTVSFDHLVNGRQELAFELPELNGSYELALSATEQNVPTGEVVKPFVRTRYPWEHNPAGRGATVYAPFTPIVVKANQVDTVLRHHTMSTEGLWSQVTSCGKPLLAAPMRYSAVVDGQAAPIAAQAPVFTVKQQNRAVATTGFKAGALKASSVCTWDYDGTMRVDLTLQPTNGKQVNELTLDIPLRDADTTMLHAMGDGIRNTLYQRIPKGDGVVWSAEKVQSEDIPHNFCAYIYAGNANRGLCWFAENDRGWGWNPKTPNLELIRSPNSLTMRIHLINSPLVIQKPRTITFGLLAAPVKPRLSPWQWRYYREKYRLLGTDINWFALGDCGSVYPAGKDMHLWEMLKKGNQQPLSDKEVEDTVTYGMKYFEPFGAEYASRFPPHVRHNLRAHVGGKMVFYYNRASYQAADEFQTFQDEWDETDFRSVGPGASPGEIKIVPTESYIDHALYWYAKSFDIGNNRGVYWDNWFFASSYNTQMTAAYTRQDGATVPSTGIWGLRELAKRTFQMMNERNMLPVTFPHMTSTSILPMLAFATVQYDWEWHYSEGDVQGRFPREYLQLVSNGQLAGVWPVVLGDQGPQSQDPWIQRTFTAVNILHELMPSGGVDAVWTPLLKPIFEMLDQKGVKTYRYWDETAQPIRADNPNLPSIVYAVPGKQAVAVVVSYADADTQAKVSVDGKALGLASWRAIDAETGQEIAPASDGTLTFPLKKHDLREIKVVAK